MIKNIYRQSEDCLLENMGGDILLYIPSTASALQLNDTSRIIWELCDGERSVKDIIEGVSEFYPDQASQIAEDVCKAIQMLSDRQVLELVK
jgi:hypothetical protein